MRYNKKTKTIKILHDGVKEEGKYTIVVNIKETLKR